LSGSIFTGYDEDMWVDTAVEAMVEYRASLNYPVLRAIRWNGRRITLQSRPRIERSSSALLYRFDEGSTRYALRFEPQRQRWFLEGVDDSGIVEFPPPKVFPPSGWCRGG
jgi:hypothetical protein